MSASALPTSPPPPPARPAVSADPSVSLPLAEVYAVAQEYLDANRLDAAERMFDHILAAYPAHPTSLHAKGLIAHRRGNQELALTLLERSIQAGATRALHWRNISEVYRLRGRLDDAMMAGRRAITLDPADPLGPFNMAMVLYDRLELPACISAARHCLDLRPDLPQGHMKLAQALLAVGAFKDGWEHYEWRYKIPGAAPLMPPTDRPQWDGRPLNGERLLLIGDQGYGDVLMFGRYISWVRTRVEQVVLACSREMEETVRRIAPGLTTTNQWDKIPPYAAYIPLSGLPRLHATTLETIPSDIPYLRAEPGLAAQWKQRLDSLVAPGLKRIGIAWAGRPTHNNDHNRSLPLTAFGPLAEVPGIALISLQKGPAAEQAKGWKGAAPLISLSEQIETFEDTAAIIDGLDLVVCVDTSVAHLAGATGKPAWILVPYAPDWRWLLGRSDTPWYPSLRLFRSPGPKRLEDAVAAAAQALPGWLAGRDGPPAAP